jgi:hypothetical protein
LPSLWPDLGEAAGSSVLTAYSNDQNY